MIEQTPNLSVNRTVGKLPLRVPSALRAPAAGYLKHSPFASLMENAGLSRCPFPPLRYGKNQGHETDRFAAAQLRVSQTRKSGSIGGVLKHREVRASLSPCAEHALSLHCVEK